MAEVRVREHESFESALRRFKRACERAGIMTEVKRHQQFEKPSERKKRKAMMARSRRRQFIPFKEG